MATVALGVEYDGGAFRGFQRQRNAPSVQQALEDAASRVANEPVRVVGAGRTDAGVHATQQVVSFVTPAERSAEAWRRGVSSLTPAALEVVWARVLDHPFDARRDARWRRYVYLLSDAPARPALHRGRVGWSRGFPTLPRSGDGALDAAAMHDAAQCLLGERDFSAFRAAGCQSKTPWRCVRSIIVTRRGDVVAVDVTANAFLLRMVRNIASALREVGVGNLTAPALAELFAAGDRGAAPPTAPPQGLYLVWVGYPELPLSPRWPLATDRP